MPLKVHRRDCAACLNDRAGRHLRILREHGQKTFRATTKGVFGPVADDHMKISHCASLACYMHDDRLTRPSFEKVLVERLESFCKAQDLKTVAITDGPNL